MKRTSGIGVQDQLININWRGLGKDKASLRGTSESVLHRTVSEVPCTNCLIGEAQKMI